jgi:hypothetical protein
LNCPDISQKRFTVSGSDPDGFERDRDNEVIGCEGYSNKRKGGERMMMEPIPMIPLLIITRDKTLMGEFVNRKLTTLLAIIFVGIILVFNSYLLFSIIHA